MPAFVPLVVLVLAVGAFRTGRPRGESTLREEILAAALLLGASILLGTEALGAFHAISARSVALFWLAVLVAASVVLARRWQRFGAPTPWQAPQLDATDRVLVGVIAAISLVVFVVAWLSPPQSSDSIGYHMSRVMHWIQNRSLAHYPTADPPQLFEPPLADVVRLHLFLLTGGDRAGCLLQWFAAMGSLAGASLVARDLGGGRRAQIFAAVFAVTLPIGLTQASSGKNGWVEALWLLCLMHFGASFAAGERARPPGSRMFAACAALGLELTTKISAWLFAPPLVLLAMWGALRVPPTEPRRLLRPVAAGALLVAALALPYLARNLSLYGHPLVDPVFRAKSGLAEVTPASVASNLVRNTVFQFGTGIAAVDEALLHAVVAVHHAIGKAPSDPRTTQFGPFRIAAPTLVEEVAFSPLHILLVFGAGLALLVSRRLRAGGARLPCLVALAAAFVLYSAMVKWQPPSCRLLMPLLVLAAPLVAAVAGEVLRGRAVPALSLVLFVACLPYATNVASRPLSLEKDRGILVTPREDLYFARVPGLRATYHRVAREVLDSRVRNLGTVFTDDGEPEYLLWMLLKEANPPVRIESVLVTDASGGLASVPPFRDFHPDLVVVFATDARTMGFDPDIVAAGERMRFVRRVGSAGLYAPTVERKNGN